MQGRLTINLKHLKENYQLLKKIASPAAVASVVKADAYGLGAKNIAPARVRLRLILHHLCIQRSKDREVRSGSLHTDDRLHASRTDIRAKRLPQLGRLRLPQRHDRVHLPVHLPLPQRL